MLDLNDYALFAEVVRHGGFAAAGRALRTPKSKLSRRIAGLEARIGIRLIERSSRRFRVTAMGEAFNARCQAILEEVDRAETLAAQAQGEPRGIVRLSCPAGLVQVLSPGLPDFLRRYPSIRLQLIAVDRPVDLIAERIDVALRVRIELTTDASMTMRALGSSRRILVASPALADTVAGSGVASLAGLATLSSSDAPDEVTWTLIGPDGQTFVHHHAPRMASGDFSALRDAAVAGLGVALLPDHTCRTEIARGELVRLLPAWGGQKGIVHIVFPSRRGLPPAVRAFIDHLADIFKRVDLND